MAAEDSVIMRKMVDNMAQASQAVLNKKPEMDNFRRIVPSLIEKGLDNINLTMFNEETRLGILNALGEEYQ
ncbi:MAG: hypothetical protein AABY13_00395, partial [Nanoarchaeota archaeon]